MANISVRGSVYKPATKESSKGKFSTFNLCEGVKQKDGTYQNFYYQVTNFHSEGAPAEKSRVEVKGWLKLRKYTKDGVEHTSLDIVADDVTSTDQPKASSAASDEKDPWDQ